MIIVADSSPLISLALLNKLNLLEELFDEITIPQAVFDEISSTEKPFSNTLEEFAKRKTRKAQNKVALSILADELDLGEAEAIILALENKIDNILIDEYKGRRIAKSKGLQIIGTIGVLIQAKENGSINNLRPLLDKLISNNIYISSGLYEEALKLAGEN